MAQRPFGKKGGAHEEPGHGGPQPKKRRMENQQPDEEWDDSFEFTQQDLERIDVISSQAIVEPSTSKQHEHAEQTLELEPMPSTSIGPYVPGVFQAPAPGATVRVKNRSSTSSSSDSSVYPQSSASFRKTPSSDVSSAAGSLTSKASSGSHSSVEHPTECPASTSPHNGAASSIVTITTLREDLRKKAEEAQKARTELYAKDGEVKFLKDALHKQEAELERLRADREERREAEDQRLKEREAELKQQVERLKTQNQFQAQDLAQLQQVRQSLESRLTQQQQQTSSASPTTSSTASERSPKVRKVVPKAQRTPEKGAFPSCDSFMGAAPSPRKLAGAVQTVGTMTVEVSSSSSPLPATPARQQGRLKLDVPCLAGHMSGPQLVSRLLQYNCTDSGDMEDSGIVGLLQTLRSRLDLTELMYERVGTTARLSPVRKARRQSSPGVYTPQQLQSSSKPVVEQEHFLMALHGLRNLTEESKPHSTFHNRHHTKSQPPCGAVLLLPMLNDYLKHYIEILSCRQGAPSSPDHSTSNKSSSCETGSSLESLTSSLGVLLQQGTEYANTVENLTLCALRVLHTLVCVCDSVRWVCVMSRLGALQLQSATDTSSSSIGTDLDKDKTAESGAEGDDEQSTSSSKGSFFISPAESLSSPSSRLEGLNLLVKLLRLASPSQESSGFKSSVVEAALDILISLAVRSSDEDLDRLQAIILRGIVADCLQLEQEHRITTRSLDLFTALARSRSIVPFLCTKSDSCSLLNVHLVPTRLLLARHSEEQLQAPLLCIVSKVLDCISSLLSYHRNGVHILTDNNCRCSGQVITSLVRSLFCLMRDYQVSHREEVLSVLRRGVLILHEISVRDPNFQQRRSAVHLYYSILMAGLSRVYKNTEGLPQEEVSAVEDLWEELDESDSVSPDSEHEDEPIVIE